jgi:amino acid adenylation domain-containing protein
MFKQQESIRNPLGRGNDVAPPFGSQALDRNLLERKQARIVLDEDDVERLRFAASQCHVTVESLCYVAWAQVLYRLFPTEEILFRTLICESRQSESLSAPIGKTVPVPIDWRIEVVEAVLCSVDAFLTGMRSNAHASSRLIHSSWTGPGTTGLSTFLIFSDRPELYRPSVSMERMWELAEGQQEEGVRFCPINFFLNDRESGFEISVQTIANTAPLRLCEFMRAAVNKLAEVIQTTPSIPVHSIDVLPRIERFFLLDDCNSTQREFPSESCLHVLFENQVNDTPDALAITFEGAHLSYSELNFSANRLARYLRKCGVKPESRVGICIERSLELMVALLAVLKAGGAYVPLDSGYPDERLRSMLAASSATLLLADGEGGASFVKEDNAIPVVNICKDSHMWASYSTENLDAKDDSANPLNLAYVIYTSGSTGTPKGVAVQHRSVVNLVTWMGSVCRIGSGDSLLQKTPISFDASVTELFWPLSVGARLVLARPGGHKDPGYLIEAIRENNVTVIQFVPSLLNAFLDDPDAVECKSLTWVQSGGEALSAALFRRFQNVLPQAILQNLYGPTETTVDATACCIDTTRIAEQPSIGRPVSNSSAYVLDEHGHVAPINVVGELYVGGVGVARGYLNSPSMTAERFVADPFAGGKGKRMYRTGDLARWLPDGEIEFLGRRDSQVKIRGYRIELDEITARFLDIDGIDEAVVIARKEASGQQRLVAYYTCKTSGTNGLAPRTLHAQLSKVLPDYMVPGVYVRLDCFSRTTNGKLDRSNLPPPRADSYVRGTLAGNPRKGNIEAARRDRG